jgi:N-acetylmuramoyl-L-alanine amidase
VIVIDAGHGGNDPGAVAKDLREKDVCLDVARRLADLLNRKPGMKASLSRAGDVFLPLRQRLRLAEQRDAELFVSIHVNAAPSRQARGTEVYFLSLGAATDAASREVARLENESDPDYVVEEDGDLRQLPFLIDLRQSDTLLRSSRAAELVLDVLTRRSLAESRGVKQAGFAVLKSFQVPSVLVELGFISSKQDRKDLADPAHRQKLAEALADGVSLYFERFAPHRSGGTP